MPAVRLPSNLVSIAPPRSPHPLNFQSTHKWTPSLPSSNFSPPTPPPSAMIFQLISRLVATPAETSALLPEKFLHYPFIAVRTPASPSHSERSANRFVGCAPTFPLTLSLLLAAACIIPPLYEINSYHYNVLYCWAPRLRFLHFCW